MNVEEPPAHRRAGLGAHERGELLRALLEQLRSLVQFGATLVRADRRPLGEGGSRGVGGSLGILHGGGGSARRVFAGDRVLTSECRRVLRRDIATANDQLRFFHRSLRVCWKKSRAIFSIPRLRSRRQRAWLLPPALPRSYAGRASSESVIPLSFCVRNEVVESLGVGDRVAVRRLLHRHAHQD